MPHTLLYPLTCSKFGLLTITAPSWWYLIYISSAVCFTCLSSLDFLVSYCPQHRDYKAIVVLLRLVEFLLFCLVNYSLLHDVFYVACRRWHAAVETDVRRVERKLPLPIQRQKGGPSTRQLPSSGWAAADQHQVLPDWHLLQRHEAEERPEADHVGLRVPVPGWGPGRHAGLDQSHTGEQQPGWRGASLGFKLLGQSLYKKQSQDPNFHKQAN